jgi:hypothetical protein
MRSVGPLGTALTVLIGLAILACEAEDPGIGPCGCFEDEVKHFESCTGPGEFPFDWETRDEFLALCDYWYDPQPIAPASDDALAYRLTCGCLIESVGTCGEYIEVDGAFVTLELPTFFGPMPFCGLRERDARMDGEVVEGVFRSSTFELAN